MSTYRVITNTFQRCAVRPSLTPCTLAMHNHGTKTDPPEVVDPPWGISAILIRRGCTPDLRIWRSVPDLKPHQLLCLPSSSFRHFHLIQSLLLSFNVSLALLCNVLLYPARAYLSPFAEPIDIIRTLYSRLNTNFTLTLHSPLQYSFQNHFHSSSL